MGNGSELVYEGPGFRTRLDILADCHLGLILANSGHLHDAATQIKRRIKRPDDFNRDVREAA